MTHYTPEQVATRWAVSTTTIYRLLARNELHSFKVGRRRVVLEDSVEAFERGGAGVVVPLRRN